MVSELSNKEKAQKGLKAYSIESNHRLNAVLKSVGSDVSEELNFKKNLATFKRKVKGVQNGSDDFSTTGVLNLLKPMLDTGLNFYSKNPESITSVLDSVSDASGFDVRKFGVNEMMVSEFMRQSANGSYARGIEFVTDAILGNLGTLPGMYVREKIRTVKRSFEDAKEQRAFDRESSDELSKLEGFGLGLVETSDMYKVSVKDLLVEKDLAPHLSSVYSSSLGVSGLDYAIRQANMSVLAHTNILLLDEFKESFIPSDLTDKLKSFSFKEGGLISALVSSQIDRVAKKNLVPTLMDYSLLTKSFSKNSMEANKAYVNHFE